MPDAEPGAADGVFLESERLVLREFTPDDLQLLVELDSDPEVKRYIDNGAPVDRDELTSMLQTWIGWSARSPGYGTWAAIEKASGLFLGWFHLRPGDGAGPSEPELGYRLRRDAWGQGYATEGSRALVEKAFGELGAERVYASTMVVNTASRRVMEKAGLRYVRTFHAEWPVRIPGDEEGDVEYAVERAEWQRSRTSS